MSFEMTRGDVRSKTRVDKVRESQKDHTFGQYGVRNFS